MAFSLSSTLLRPPPLSTRKSLTTKLLNKQPQRINCIKKGGGGGGSIKKGGGGGGRIKKGGGGDSIKMGGAGDSIHPKFHEDATVFCNGEHVLTVGGTQPEYVVDVWSGNHPFYLGSRSNTLVDDDQVSKFRKKYGGLTQFMEIPVLKGEIKMPPKRKSAGKGAKKK